MIRIQMILIVLMASLATAMAVHAHGGGMDKHGCHMNRKEGIFQCHKGPLAGQTFANKSEAQAALGQSQQSSPPSKKQVSPSPPVSLGIAYDRKLYGGWIDADGDGVFEYAVTADSDLTYEEFTLQTATRVDFDPDTLGLRSTGKVVTAYIELPLGYGVDEIDISSIRLNGTVPALPKPTEVGDHDGDGVPDLMVKFDRAAVQDILAAGEEVEITITGEVSGITLKGSDSIRVMRAVLATH